MVRVRMNRALGRVLNIFGAPGFIRPSECRARLGVPVEVRVNDLFTIVSVDNLRLMFHRLNGQLDGIVIDGDCCQPDGDRANRPTYSAPTPR